MSIIVEQFQKAKYEFDKERVHDDGNAVMREITTIINDLGKHFANLDGGELSEAQMKIAGYKFHVSDYMAWLMQQYEAIKVEIVNIYASRWDEVAETIKAEKGRVKNKQEIENVLAMETRGLQDQRILYETEFYKYKLKSKAIEEILTAIVQRIAELKRQVELSKLG